MGMRNKNSAPVNLHVAGHEKTHLSLGCVASSFSEEMGNSNRCLNGHCGVLHVPALCLQCFSVPRPFFRPAISLTNSKSITALLLFASKCSPGNKLYGSDGALLYANCLDGPTVHQRNYPGSPAAVYRTKAGDMKQRLWCVTLYARGCMSRQTHCNGCLS